MTVNVALTGAVAAKDDDPHTPLSPEEIAEDALRCVDAGATAMHLHVRDESGLPTHRRDLYERAIGPVRDKRPDLIICTTTGSRVNSDLGARMTALNLDGALRPDMASLTLWSFNFPLTASVDPGSCG